MIGVRYDAPIRTASFRATLFKCWLGVAMLILAVNALNIWTLQFPDPDDQLRLVQVRDLLAGQSWFDLRQHRAAAIDGGVPMHWSRLVDVPLAVTIGLLRPLIGQAGAELAALIAIPLIALGVAMALVMRIAWRRLGLESVVFVALTFALCVPVIEQLRPMRIDHHGWQLVLLIAAVSGLAVQSSRIGGLVIGFCLAALISISIEGLPMAIAITGIAALRWLNRQDDGGLLSAALIWLAAGSAAIFVATRGLADVNLHCDAIAPQHLAALSWVAICTVALRAAKPKSALAITAGLAIAAGGAAALVLGASPECAQGNFVALDPVVRDTWLHRINEGLPIWEQRPSYAAQVLAMPLLGLWGVYGLFRTSSGQARQWWFEYGLLLVAALAVACLVIRAGAAAGLLATVPAGWQLRRWLAAIRSMDSLPRQIAAYAGTASILLPASFIMLASLAVPALGDDSASAAGYASGPSEAEMAQCRKTQLPAILRNAPATTVLAPVDLGPAILLDSRHGVVATGHHRGSAAMREVIEAYMGNGSRAHAVVRRHRIGIVVACKGQPEFEMYRHFAPQGFAGSLAGNRAPDWLEPMPVLRDSPYRLWRVIR